jgi:hypothetical protein
MIGGKQHKKQQPEASKNLLWRIIAAAFAVQAALIGVKGIHDELSGKSPLDVIPWMITQSVELILKAQRTEKSIRESDRTSPPDEQ